MNVQIGTEAALFPEKEYIIGIFLAVYLEIIESWKTTFFRMQNKVGTNLSILIINLHQQWDLEAGRTS